MSSVHNSTTQRARSKKHQTRLANSKTFGESNNKRNGRNPVFFIVNSQRVNNSPNITRARSKSQRTHAISRVNHGLFSKRSFNNNLTRGDIGNALNSTFGSVEKLENRAN